MQVSNGKRGTLFLLLWWFSVLPVPFHSSPVDFGQRAQLNYVANKSLLDLSFLGFLFLPLALRWPENTKLGQEGGVLKKKREREEKRGRVEARRPPGTEAGGREGDTTRYKYFRCLISAHHSAYLLAGERKASHQGAG